MINTLLAPFYKWIVIALVVFIIGYVAYANKLAGDLGKAKQDCEQRIVAALKPYLEAEKAAQANANRVSDKYENTKQAERVRTETIEPYRVCRRLFYLS